VIANDTLIALKQLSKKGYMLVQRVIFLVLLLLLTNGCLPISKKPVPGPDKQAVGTWYGAAVGAGSGAVIGAEATAATGPGAAIGAGFGALYGMFTGLGTDMLEEDQLRRQDEMRYQRELNWAQEVLAEHYVRRLELHPGRDIFPADLFFCADGTELKPESKILVRELARNTRTRMPWSRIVIASYATSSDADSVYASYLTRRRSESIAKEFVRTGLEARRVFTKSRTLPEPILIDPDDSTNRYQQSIEIIALDY